MAKHYSLQSQLCLYVLQVVKQSGFAIPTEEYIKQRGGQVPAMGAGGQATAIVDSVTKSLKYLTAAWLIDAPVLQEEAENNFVLRNRLHLQVGKPSSLPQISRAFGTQLADQVRFLETVVNYYIIQDGKLSECSSDSVKLCFDQQTKHLQVPWSCPWAQI
jgi:hypothetical protein